MILAKNVLRRLKPQSTKRIFFISMTALVLGLLMINTYVPNEGINFAGLLITSLFIYYFTLRKNDIFSFVMVIYFCSIFPYLPVKGGGFNLVSFICIGFYFLSNGIFFVEKKLTDPWFDKLVFLFVLSSFLGWLINYTGKGMDFLYSFLTFFGLIFLLLVSSRLEITSERIKVFLQLNLILIVYSTIASLNKYLHLVTIDTPLMPIYGKELKYFEGGGLVGSSPLYGEHSMMLFLLFAAFFILKHKIGVNRVVLLIGAFIAIINVFMSISRSVFLLSLAGVALIYILQFKINRVQIRLQFLQLFVLAFLGFATLVVVNTSGLGYVFQRMDKIESSNKKAGGISIDRILDGSAFNRETAFKLSKEKYRSRDSWIVGYGWGIGNNNRDAFYVNTKVKRGTAHSQIFAVLFIFGWIGFIAYWGLIFRAIWKSYRNIGNKKADYIKRVMAFFFCIAFGLFALNEIKADSVSFPYYFAVTIIWLGMAFSANNPNNETYFIDKTENYGY